MAREWAKAEREGWLDRLYGRDNEDGTRTLQPESIQHRLLDNLEALLSHNVSPKEAAAQTLSLIMSEVDTGTPWSNNIGLHLKAAQAFDDERVLQALVDYIVELASFPDSIYEGLDRKTIGTPVGIEHVKLDGTVEIDSRVLWRELPDYSMTLSEWLQGE